MASSLSPINALFTWNQVFFGLADWFDSWLKSTVLIFPWILRALDPSFCLLRLGWISHRSCLGKWNLDVIGNVFVFRYLILEECLRAWEIFHILNFQAALTVKFVFKFDSVLLLFLCLHLWAEGAVLHLALRRFAIWVQQVQAWVCFVVA